MNEGSPDWLVFDYGGSLGLQATSLVQDHGQLGWPHLAWPVPVSSMALLKMLSGPGLNYLSYLIGTFLSGPSMVVLSLQLVFLLFLNTKSLFSCFLSNRDHSLS